MLPTIVRSIKESSPVYFSKYGDGEYMCMTTENGFNCDNDRYTPTLAKSLKSSFQTMIRVPNSFIGKWHTRNVTDYLESLANVNVPWVNYHTIMSYPENFDKPDLRNLVKEIRNTNDNVIIVSNKKNIKMREFFNADSFVVIPECAWFDTYYVEVFSEICKNIDKKESRSIVLTSAGLGAKVLIANLTLKYKDHVSCLDTGSSFDYLLTGVPTRHQKWDVKIEHDYYLKTE